jgi:hypothetical protein
LFARAMSSLRKIARTRANNSRGLKGLRDIVVGAQLEADDAVDVVASMSRDDDDRDIGA